MSAINSILGAQASRLASSRVNTNTRVRSLHRLIWPLVFAAWTSLLRAEVQPVTPSWIATNPPGSHLPPYPYKGPRAGYVTEWEITPSVSNSVANAASYFNADVRLFVRFREPMLCGAQATAIVGNRIVANYDFRAMDKTESTNMTREEIKAAWAKKPSLLGARYFRGRCVRNAHESNTNEWATVFSSDDKRRLVFVHDSGYIRVSENTGLGWKFVDRPGVYEFTISSTPKGSVMVATVSLGPHESALAVAKDDWYCTASAADGSQLVLTGGPSQSAPVLSIARFGNDIIISWPAAYTGFALQKTADILTPNWVDVTNRVETVDTQNQIILSGSSSQNCFRLIRR